MTTTAPESAIHVYLKQINAYALLTAGQERELGWQVINDNDQAARDALVNANLRLVVAISRKYQHRGLPLAELIAEGNVGLIRAAEGFDPAHGVRFSTYATLPIKRAIRKAIFTGAQPCQVPAYMAELIAKCHATSKVLEAVMDRPPTSQELAEAMDIPVKSLGSIRRAQQSRNSSVRTGDGFSGDQVDSTSLLEDCEGATPEESPTQRETIQKVVRLLDSIDGRNARILKMRLGLEGQKPLALCQISRELGITKERVRQIELQGRRRLQALLANGSGCAGQRIADHLAA